MKPSYLYKGNSYTMNDSLYVANRLLVGEMKWVNIHSVILLTGDW